MAQTISHPSSETADRPSGMLVVFFVALLLPFSFELAGIRLSPLRLVMLGSLVPLVIALVQGHAGRLIWTDALILGYALWLVISLVANHGIGRLPLGVSNASETVSSYLLGRILIRGHKSFRRIFAIGLVSLCVLLPFAVVELFTGRIVASEFFDLFADVVVRGESAKEGRLGLERVYTVFGHPILFGIYCASLLTCSLLVLGGSWAGRVCAVALCFAMTFMSLSSAPLLAIVFQILLLAWWKLTRGAWWTLAILCVAFYVVIDLASNRTPLALFFAHATFNPRSGWIRIAIFEYGSQMALRNPTFGIGTGDWVRPRWVPNSVDNFWLVVALRYGMPAFLMLSGAVVAHFVSICRAGLAEPRDQRYRVAYLITLGALMLALVTVHVWDSAYAFVIFLIGAGSWFYTTDRAAAKPGDDEATGPDRTAPGAIHFTRFPAASQENTSSRSKNRRDTARLLSR